MFAALYLPKFHLQAILRHAPDLRSQPVALVDDSLPAKIFQCSAAAQASGVRPGMTSTQALGRCPKLLFRSPPPAVLASARDALRQCACAVSPFVEATGDGLCTIDLKSNPQPDYTRWGEALLDRLTALHFKARLGVAENPDLAFLAAQRTRRFLQVDDSREFLHDLPLAALSPAPDVCAILKKCGIHTLGALSALPKQELPRRLGVEALDLWERATGRSTRLLQLAAAPETYEEALEFEHEIETTEPLLFILRRFLDQLALRLELTWLVVAQLTLRLHFSSGPDYLRTFQVPAPTRQVDTLFRILQTHLENFRSDWPITALHLTATPCPPEQQQFGLFETALRDPNRFYETLAQLGAILGSGQIGRPVLRDSFRPEAFHLQSVEFRAATPALSKSSTLGLALRKFRPPRPIQVFSVESQPAYFVMDGTHESIQRVAGPWCSSGDWWDQTPWDRLEWDIQTDRRTLYRIFQEQGAWFAEGLYD